MKSRTWLFIYFLVVLLIVAYLVRVILTPFVLAAIFAYVLNPVVKAIERAFKVNRLVAISLIYILIFAFIFYVVAWIGTKIIFEVHQLRIEVDDLGSLSKLAVSNLPEWNIAGQSIGFQSLASILLVGLNNAITHYQQSFFEIFTGALSRVLQVLIFLVSTFYFLKDGPAMITGLKNRFSVHHQKDVENLLQQINTALGGYLRGQILLVIIMSTASTIVLSILGVPFAILIGVSSGFLELIPFIGPIAAGGIAASVGYALGTNRFGLDPTTLGIIIILFYFILRQVEDYFIVPQLLGRLTKLHPLVVLFAVLAAGKLAGPVGFILGVPVAASTRILLEYFWSRTKD